MTVWLHFLMTYFVHVRSMQVCIITFPSPFLACSEGSYGLDCASTCECQNNATCDFVSGSCSCTAGWFGTLCEMGEVIIACDSCLASASHYWQWTGVSAAWSICVYLLCTACPEGTFGQDCSSACTCVQGECHHITGNCSCYDGYLGVTCDHGKFNAS